MLYHYLAGLLPSAVPGNSMDWGRSKSGRMESRGQPRSELVSCWPKDVPTGSEGFTSSPAWATGTSRLGGRT